MFTFQTLLFLSFSADQVLAWRARRQFQHFYPDVEVDIKRAIANNCTVALQDYLSEHVTVYGKKCPIMYSCIIDNIPAYAKDNMASAAVLLGLTPFILAYLGSNTTELALISSRRSLLAILLVLGSPSVNQIRTFEYPNPAEDLQEGDSRLVLPNVKDQVPHSKGNILRVVVELVLVSASVANLFNLSWTITLNTIAVTSCDSDMLVQLWIGCAIFTHIFGVATFVTGSEMKYLRDQRLKTFLGWVKRWLLAESSPCWTHQSYKLERKAQNNWFVFWSWLASTYTLTHIGFGVTVLSSLSFVGSLDAGIILARFGASAIVCRAVATYELAGMRAVMRIGTNVKIGENEDANELAERGVVNSGISTADGAHERPHFVQEREDTRITGHPATL